MWCLISVFVFENGFALGSPQNRPRVCRYILQFWNIALFTKNPIFCNKFHFFHYIRSWCKTNIDMPSDGFEINNMYICMEKEWYRYIQRCFSGKYLKFFCFFKNEQGEKRIWILCARIRILGISTMASVQHIFTKLYTSIKQIYLNHGLIYKAAVPKMHRQTK